MSNREDYRELVKEEFENRKEEDRIDKVILREDTKIKNSLNV